MDIGEEGDDAGGVRKEFFQLLISKLLDVQYGMFCTAGKKDRLMW